MNASPETSPGFLQNSSNDALLFPDEPPSTYTKADFDRFLVWASKSNASDINFITGMPAVLEVNGRYQKVTRRTFSQAELNVMVSDIYGSDSIVADLNGGKDKDFSYDFKPDRTSRYRFRVNVTGIVAEGRPGINVTLRTISSKPPRLADLGLEDAIFNAMAPKQGMVIITGSTGSGKSTLLAAMMRHLLEDPNGNRKVLTYESPIEYVYDEIVMPTSMICQSEVPRNLKDFSAGTRNSLRRAPKIILVGEARDAETIGEAITVSQTGHALYSTVHSDDVATTIPRMVAEFPEGERHSRMSSIINAMRLIVSQRLEKTPQGGRVALREFVVITPEIRDRLLQSDLDSLGLACRAVLEEFGQSFLQDARRKHQEGRLADEALRRYEAADRASRKDVEFQAEHHAGLASQPAPRARPSAGVVAIDEPTKTGDTRLDNLGGLL